MYFCLYWIFCYGIFSYLCLAEYTFFVHGFAVHFFILGGFMKKKTLILLIAFILIFVAGILSGYYIHSYSESDKEKIEAFSAARKVCENNIEIAQKMEAYIEELENGEKTNDFIDRLGIVRTQIKKRYDTNGKHLEDILKDYIQVSEAGVTMALDNYRHCGNCLAEAFFLLDENMTDEEKKLYNEYITTAKEEIKSGKEFFQSYIEKLK